MLNCLACGAASISPRRVLMPAFGAVITCPACKAALRNTSRQSISCSVAMVLTLGPVAHLTDDWPSLMVVLLTLVIALGCYGVSAARPTRASPRRTRPAEVDDEEVASPGRRSLIAALCAGG